MIEPDAHEELRRLAAQYWDHDLRLSPMYATLIGVHDYDHLFRDAGRDAEDQRISALRRIAGEAEAIDPGELTNEERITRDVLIFEASTQADVTETRAAEWAVSHIFGSHLDIALYPSQMTFLEPGHAIAMVERLRHAATYFEDAAERLRDGVSKGMVPMRSTAEKAASQVDEILAQDPSPILDYQAPEGWDGEQAWRHDLASVFADFTAPAMARWRDTVREIVLPAARPDERPGICNLPGGEETYTRLLRRFTTTPMTPAQIHQMGIDQIERLADEYREVAGSVLGTTDLTEIFSRMREDPDLRCTEPAPILAASRAAVDRAKAAMSHWFGRLPKADCVVVETSRGPAAHYLDPAADGSRPGTFFVNTANPARWAAFQIEALAFHEAIPGHHLHFGITVELDGIPDFRRYADLDAHAEGWALYAERLADEMGLYGTPLDRLGMLSGDSLRAGRLVVDTGIHALGWTRRQAVEYLAENTPYSLAGIEEEVDRYTARPGQATSYMSGRLEIERMRRDAEVELDDRFDLKGFHDTLLGSGPVPLEILDRLVQSWVASVEPA
ncbi:MAG TPA: DUF885 domain-containing protein [Acidimicrobiia bacterium]